MEAEKYEIPEERFENAVYIEQRAAAATPNAQGAVRTALSYLYLSSGPMNLPRDRMKLAQPFVEPRKWVLLRWLHTRTNGSLRSTYGTKALLVARTSRYRCCSCGFADVRALHIDRVDGRVKDTEYSCLCANCHNIKSREKDWSGAKRYP